MVPGARPDAAKFPFLLVEDLDLLDSREVILQNGVELGQPVLGPAEAGQDLFGETNPRKKHEGYGEKGAKGQEGIEVKKNDTDANEDQEVNDEIRNGVGDQHLKGGRVIGGTRH